MPPPVGRKRVALLSLLLAPALAAGPAAADDAGLAPVDPVSTGAEGISDTYFLILGFSTFIFLLVTGSLLLFVVRYRSRGRPREIEGPQMRGHTRLELAWTALPVVILIIVATFVFYKLDGIEDPSAAAGATPDQLDIRVDGHRFYWQFKYPNGVIALDHLRVPEGRVVDLAITATESDVIHSWWIPALGGKKDAVPGEENHLRFRATRTGTFEGQCAEFCGIQHAVMDASVEVLSEDDFDRWLASEATAQQQGQSTLGEATYVAACSKCHGLEAQGLVGPAIAGNSTLQNREGLEEIVRNGQEEMPPVGPQWNERQMDALFRYVSREFRQAGGETDGG